MQYQLVKSTTKDIKKLIGYKKATIYDYAKDLTCEEKEKIELYIMNTIPDDIKRYFNIVCYDKTIGCLLLKDYEDGILLDEIYLEEEYRNQGIGTDIIKNILKENEIVYLWVYKENKKAICLYQTLNFQIINETETRYFMKYEKSNEHGKD